MKAVISVSLVFKNLLVKQYENTLSLVETFNTTGGNQELNMHKNESTNFIQVY